MGRIDHDRDRRDGRAAVLAERVDTRVPGEEFDSGREAMRATSLIENLAYVRLSYFGAAGGHRNVRNGVTIGARSRCCRALFPCASGCSRSGGVLETSATVALPQR